MDFFRAISRVGKVISHYDKLDKKERVVRLKRQNAEIFQQQKINRMTNSTDQKWREREAKIKQKALQQMVEQQAKLSSYEQARLEVEIFDNSIEVLLSIHKEARPTFNWLELYSALQPHKPVDSNLFAEYEKANADWNKMRLLAKRVLAKDVAAYGEALSELSAFGELLALGTAVTYTLIDAKLILCEVKVNGRNAIPANIKSTTATGKLTVKPMPAARFKDLYQDYVCGCVLRVGREVLALLPIETVIVTAMVDTMQSSTGRNAEIPIVSVALPREILTELDFDQLDPSDSVNNFVHRGDMLVSKKSAEFIAISPLKPDDLTTNVSSGLRLIDTLERVREKQSELSMKIKKLKQTAQSDT